MDQFLQTDPVGYEGDDLNLYQYALNDPLSFRDSTGRRVLEISRPVRFGPFRIGTHTFTQVIPDDGSAWQRFSYGPTEGEAGTAFDAIGNSGRLTSQTGTGSPTDIDDSLALSDVMNNRASENGVSVRVLDVTDGAAISAGQLVDEGLANTRVPYNAVPDNFDVEAGRGFNSNTATQLLEDLAAETSGTPSPGPAGSGYTPGTEFSDELREQILP